MVPPTPRMPQHRTFRRGVECSLRDSCVHSTIWGRRVTPSVFLLETVHLLGASWHGVTPPSVEENDTATRRTSPTVDLGPEGSARDPVAACLARDLVVCGHTHAIRRRARCSPHSVVRLTPER